ncbi:MAG TPA: helix-turn-helix domain-containing protein [Solirubrobacterales bacterium]|nr:helix-turn-helix domain-containing protein [Solirubrobacterales bacterium]
MSNRSRRSARAAADPRERLIAGMTQAAARYGYREASVARVVEQAGVSRTTFYEHFSDKEACFLAAFQQAAARIEIVLPQVEEEFSPALRAEQLLDDLLTNIVRDPAAARILLLEARAGGPQVRQAYERFVTAVGATLERWLSGPGENGYRLNITGRAIMEGTGGILVVRVFRGETARLAELRDDLLAWIYSYAVPEAEQAVGLAHWRRIGSAMPLVAPQPQLDEVRRLPRGRSAVRPEAVADEHRQRILVATMSLARTKGYEAMTVADIVKAGAVTREVFYDLFRSKEDVFLAAQTAVLERSISRTAAAFFRGDSWPERAWIGLEALLELVAAEPDLVYLDVIESYSVGAAAVRRSFDNLMAYTLFLEDGYRQSPAAERMPRLCSEAIGNAILGLMCWEVLEGRTEEMMKLLPQAAYLVLAPFLGPEAAREMVEAKAAAQVRQRSRAQGNRRDSIQAPAV